MRNRWVYPSSGIQWKKKNGLLVFLSFFLFLLYSPLPLYGLHSLFSNFKNPRPYNPFLFAHTLLTGWNSEMTTKTKIVQLRARRTCLVWEVSVHYTQNVHLIIWFCFVLFFWTTKAGLASIFEIKCNCF